MTERLSVKGNELYFDKPNYNQIPSGGKEYGGSYSQPKTSFEEAKKSMEEHLKRPLTAEEIERIK